MRTNGRYFWILAALLSTGCAVMSTAVEQEALPPMDFQELIRHAAQYKGQMVVLGGYVVEVANREDHTRLVAVQAPLGFGQEPRSRDLSQGRLILIYRGFLDPEVYTAGRKLTVGGRVLGSSTTDPDPAPFPYVRLEVQEVHLWPAEQPLPRDHYYYRPYWGPYYPWGWRHPYWW